LLHYDTGADDQTPWGLGLGCNGAVDIFVQPPAAQDVTRCLATLLQGDDSFTVSTIVAGSEGLGQAIVAGRAGKLAGTSGNAEMDRVIQDQAIAILAEGDSQLRDLARVQVFTEVLAPPPTVLVLGAGEDARPIAAYAGEAGFRIVVADHRPAYLESAHYPAGTRLLQARPTEASAELPLGPRTFAVVKTHSLSHDREWVRRLLRSEVPYIGVLGPRARVEDVLRQLGAEGNERVFGPVGLNLGGEGPEQIALSITAELLAVWSGRQPGHLREKDGVIHAG
jgi:xanthine/CO dehydrogenase XdhC/CoxF family maturation factor